MRAVWVNDIHLDFLDRDAVDRFLLTILSSQPDVLLVGGDISTARFIEQHLQRIEESLAVPICFVLGNHDFYHGSIAGVRRQIHELCERTERLHWLNKTGVFPLTGETALVGHDGWGDARLGNYETSNVELSDFYLIDELRARDRGELVKILRRLGDEAADHFRTVLPEALASFPCVLLLTHVPPFPEAAWYEGKVSNEDWVPFFCCKVVGDVLTEQMLKHSESTLTVLCGHTHGEGEVQILPNLRVITGGARYRHPRIQAVLELE